MNPLDNLRGVTSALASKRPAMLSEYRTLLIENLAGVLPEAKSARLVDLARELGKSAYQVREDAQTLHNVNELEARLKVATSPELAAAHEQAKITFFEHQEETTKQIMDRNEVKKKLRSEMDRIGREIDSASIIREHIQAQKSRDSTLFGA